VFDLVFENSIEDQQWPFDRCYLGGPASMLKAIVFEDADNDLLVVLD
jgi:hypothetical protein